MNDNFLCRSDLSNELKNNPTSKHSSKFYQRCWFCYNDVFKQEEKWFIIFLKCNFKILFWHLNAKNLTTGILLSKDLFGFPLKTFVFVKKISFIDLSLTTQLVFFSQIFIIWIRNWVVEQFQELLIYYSEMICFWWMFLFFVWIFTPIPAILWFLRLVKKIMFFINKMHIEYVILKCYVIHCIILQCQNDVKTLLEKISCWRICVNDLILSIWWKLFSLWYTLSIVYTGN